MRLKSLFWAKSMRKISDKYREGYDRIRWNRDDDTDKQAEEPATGRRRERAQ